MYNNLLTPLSQIPGVLVGLQTLVQQMPKGLAISSAPLTECNSENMKNYLLLSVFYSAFELVVGGAESLPILQCEKKPIISDSPTLITYIPD